MVLKALGNLTFGGM